MIKIIDAGWGDTLPEGYEISLIKDLPLLKKVKYLWITVSIKVHVFAWWNKTFILKFALKAF